MNQRRIGAVLSYVLLFIRNGISLFLLPFMLRTLGKSEYGLYQLVGSLSAYLFILDLGLSSTVTRYVAKYRAHHNTSGQEGFVALILVIYTLLAGVTVAAGLVLYHFLPQFFAASLTIEELAKARTMLLLLVANASVTILTNSFSGICAAYERFIFLRSQDIIHSIIRVVVLVLLLSTGYGAVAIVVTDLVLNTFFAGIRVAYSFSHLRIHLRLNRADWTLLNEVMGFAVFIFLNAIIDQMYWKTGNIILGVLKSTAFVAVYSIGAQITMLYIAFSTAISSVLLPQTVIAVENRASGSELTDLMVRTGRIQLLVLGIVLIGFLAFGREFINLWVGPGYETAYGIAVVVLIPLSIPLVQNVGISILQAKNKHQFRALAYLVCAVLNIIITIILVPHIGMMGAAWGTAIGLTLGNIIFINIYYHRAIELDIPRFFHELGHGILPVLLCMLLVGVCFTQLWPEVSWLAFMAKIAVFAILYAGGMWFWGMNQYEKDIISLKRLYATLQRAE